MPKNKNGIVAATLIACVAIIGLAMGFYVPDSALRHTAETAPSAELPQETPISLEINDSAQSFSLSKFDIQDRMQTPQLATDGKGNVWIAWESKSSEVERTLFLSHSKDSGRNFSEPVAVHSTSIYKWDAMIRGRSAKRESRMWPHLGYSNNQLILSWVQSETDDAGVQSLVYVESSDLGKTFTDPQQLSTDVAVRPTFVGFATDDSGSVTATWLDHRNNVQQPFAATNRQRMKDQLVYAGPDDKGICPCCDLDVIYSSQGDTLIAFRNNRDGFRDMWIAIREHEATEFSSPIPIIEPRWEFNGCPHDGPKMAIIGDNLHIVWMDAHTGVQQVYHGRAKMGEWKFDVSPIHVSPNMQGHPFLIARGDELRVVWDEAGASDQNEDAHSHGSIGGARIMYAMSTDDGEGFSNPIVLSDDSDAFCSRPNVTQIKSQLIVSWTELSESGKLIKVKAKAIEPSSQSAYEVARNER